MIKNIIYKIFHNYPDINEFKTLLAVSGGIDSMVMMSIFQNMGADFEVAHCNFKLRGKDSDLDEKFVIDYCEKHQIKHHIQRFNTELLAKELKLSIQETARDLRYSFFSELSIEFKFDFVLIAHNLNDSFETFIINLTRGTGINGLLGIPNNNERIIRPISFLSRDEIQEYAQLYNIKWREDQSNLEKKYLRNKIRHDIFPVFEEINPSFLQSFSKTLINLQNTKLLQEEALSQGYFTYIKTDKNGQIKLEIEPFVKFTENVSPYLYGWFHNYGFKDWLAIENLLYAENGKKVDGKDCYLVKDKKYLILKFSDIDIEKTVNEDSIYTLLNDQEFVDIGVLLTQEKVKNVSKGTSNKIYVNLDALKYPLILRKINKGDIIFPTGMEGSKKVSKFFKDQKMSRFERDCTYILTNATDEIIWIVGHRQDRRFEVTKNTKNIIKFEIK
jgi:tRNA(Ile)-lysidine synthase